MRECDKPEEKRQAKEHTLPGERQGVQWQMLLGFTEIYCH